MNALRKWWRGLFAAPALPDGEPLFAGELRIGTRLPDGRYVFAQGLEGVEFKPANCPLCLCQLHEAGDE